MKQTVTVEGTRALRSAAKRAGVEVAELRDAHLRAAEVVKAAAEPAAPRRTGRLAGNIRASGTKTAAIVRAGGTKVPYANPQHWGWGRRHISATLFLTRPAAATEPVWVPIYSSAVQTVLDRVASAATGRGE